MYADCLRAIGEYDYWFSRRSSTNFTIDLIRADEERRNTESTCTSMGIAWAAICLFTQIRWEIEIRNQKDVGADW